MSRGRVWSWSLAVGVAALGLWAGLIAFRGLPRLAQDAAEEDRRRGVFHVHSDSSHDGRTPAREQLEAAAELGLDFVVYAEHNRQPRHASPPGGPLAVPGTELSTEYGHLVYLGYDRVPPEGNPRRTIRVVDDLREREALTILAHPTSPKRPWLGRRAGIGGLEIASTSASARARAKPILRLVPALLAYPLNPELALAQVYRRDDEALEMWDRLEDPSVIGICGTDAHGWIDPRLDFRTWQVVLDPWPEAPEPLHGQALLDRLSTGRFSCVASLFSDGAPRFSFSARTRGPRAAQGSSVPARRVLALEVEAPVAPPGEGDAPPVTTTLLRDGVPVARSDRPTLVYEDPTAGTYRVEVRLRVPKVLLGSREVPVLYSNRIRLTD